MKPTAPIVRWFRLLRVALIILSGVTTVVFLYPFVNDRRRARLRQRWSRVLLGILGMELDARLGEIAPGSMLVANHISWIDIFVINSVLPAAFVSKADIRQWPIIGWLAAMNDTVFLKRGSHGHARLVNEEIGRKLQAGKYVAVFPEGTTTDGTHVLHFHGALLQPALLAGKPIIPLAITYWEENGERSLAPRYDGDISFGECLSSIASRRRLTARLQTLPPLGLAGEDRRVVAVAAREAIIGAAQIPALSRLLETNADPPDGQRSVDSPTGNRNQSPGGLAAA